MRRVRRWRTGPTRRRRRDDECAYIVFFANFPTHTNAVTESHRHNCCNFSSTRNFAYFFCGVCLQLFCHRIPVDPCDTHRRSEAQDIDKRRKKVFKSKSLCACVLCGARIAIGDISVCYFHLALTLPATFRLVKRASKTTAHIQNKTKFCRNCDRRRRTI